MLDGDQHEARIAYVADMPTFNLIAQVVPEMDVVSWMMTLTEIMAQPEQVFA